MIEFVLLLQAFSTISMVGLIWFVQIVHYPLFDRVGQQNFRGYESAHQTRTTLVVAPLMLTEAASAILVLAMWPTAQSSGLPWFGAALLAAIWASTFLLQVPAHEKLSRSYDARTHRWLVNSNWFRTFAWSLRGVLCCYMLIEVGS